MSTGKVITPLSIQLKPSKFLQRFNLVVHFLALMGNLLTPIPWYLKLCLALLIAGDYWLNYRNLKHEARQIHFSEKLGWQVSDNNLYKNIKLLPSTVITTWLVFLHTKELGPILIAKDMLNNDAFRRLIVKLRISYQQEE